MSLTTNFNFTARPKDAECQRHWLPGIRQHNRPPTRVNRSLTAEHTIWRRTCLSAPSGCLTAALAVVLLIVWSSIFGVFSPIVAMDGGPIINRHRGIGQSGRYFDCYRFRTMIVGAHGRELSTIRIVPVVYSRDNHVTLTID